MRWWPVTVSVVIFAVAGCADTSGGGGGGGTSPPIPPTTGTDEPPTEPTTTETTQTRQDKPSLEIASLPVGGVPDEGANCNPVSWLAGDIPEGVTITLGRPRFKPTGIFAVDQSGCPGDARACPGLEWTAEEARQCWVGFRQVADEGSVTLVIPAIATCETRQQCNGLKGLGGSQIDLTARRRETPETPPDTPPETPPETPVETPSGG
ncbi:hypothetical protein [Kribbella shirazensis]|uniref:Uncharacterized protein n=1 Tax=Kribbella shirazensis TaxID=1105143 RepID=A0A7X6A402_9ACTN|nr:hypothetical protein [Kribbella shirazensis]NIK60977.1 hypothetical protein [Kribbella shirazensis]